MGIRNYENRNLADVIGQISEQLENIDGEVITQSANYIFFKEAREHLVSKYGYEDKAACELAKKFNVKHSTISDTISDIINNKQWKHI